VGDFEEETLIQAVAESFGALSERPTKPYEPDVSLTTIKFPNGTQQPIKLTHAGDAETARLYVYWPAPDGTEWDGYITVSKVANGC